MPPPSAYPFARPRGGERRLRCAGLMLAGAGGSPTPRRKRSCATPPRSIPALARRAGFIVKRSALVRIPFPLACSLAPEIVPLCGSPARLASRRRLPALPSRLGEAFRPLPSRIKRARAVALIINSPGGSALQSHLIHQRNPRARSEHKKPVISFGEESGGFRATDRRPPPTRSSPIPPPSFGSIGVISGGFGLDKALS